MANHDSEAWSAGCVQSTELPVNAGVGIDSTPQRAFVGYRCMYRSTVVGGYLAPAGDSWRVIIDRPDGTRIVYASVLGSPRCADAVILPGDWVEVASTTAIAAGGGIGCS